MLLLFCRHYPHNLCCIKGKGCKYVLFDQMTSDAIIEAGAIMPEGEIFGG